MTAVLPDPGWAPVVFGRTFTSDSWWRAVPTGSDRHGWLGAAVAAVVGGGRGLEARQRFLLARGPDGTLVGVACRAAELHATMNADPERPLYCFVGWLRPPAIGPVPVPSLDELTARFAEWAGPVYAQWIEPVWNDHPTRLREPRISVPADPPWLAPADAEQSAPPAPEATGLAAEEPAGPSSVAAGTHEPDPEPVGPADLPGPEPIEPDLDGIARGPAAVDPEPVEPPATAAAGPEPAATAPARPGSVPVPPARPAPVPRAEPPGIALHPAADAATVWAELSGGTGAVGLIVGCTSFRDGVTEVTTDVCADDVGPDSPRRVDRPRPAPPAPAPRPQPPAVRTLPASTPYRDPLPPRHASPEPERAHDSGWSLDRLVGRVLGRPNRPPRVDLPDRVRFEAPPAHLDPRPDPLRPDPLRPDAGPVPRHRPPDPAPRRRPPGVEAKDVEDDAFSSLDDLDE